MDGEDANFGGFQPKGATMSIIGAEDEDFENDIEQTMDDQFSYFQSIELVKDHPAYIMVLLHHSVLQFDPSPLLCFLHIEILRSLSAKEGKKFFLDFYYMFLVKGAVLRVPIPHSVSFELDRTRPELIPEDTQKRFMREIQSHQIPEINRQLEDFRSKRVLGMTPGEQELTELESYQTSDRHILESKEKQLAEQLLARLEDMHPTISTDEEKSTTIFCAIVTYMKHIGVKTKAADSKKNKGIFFRKKVSAKKPDEPVKTKKAFSILDPARWNRNDSHSSEKPSVPERRISHGQRTYDRSDSNAAKPKSNSGGPGEEPEVSVNIHPPPSEPSSSDNVSDGSVSLDASDQISKGSPTIELCPTEHQQDENAENESPEPGGSAEGPLSFLSTQSEESEPRISEAEIDPPNWRDLVPPEILLRLKKSEIKRQEVINELLSTEHAHVRMLRVLHDIFYLPMLRDWIPTLELENIFPSLDELIDAHAVFLDTLKRLRQENNSVIHEIGSTLLNRFDGTEGSWFQKISSRFCSRQSFALEQLKVKQKKEPRFTQFIQEAESSPQCRRLQLKDIIPFEMQRLTKYPLLLQNIANLTEEEEEKQKVQKAAECCRQILNHVNQEVREMENKMKLADYQRRLDITNLRQSNDPLFNEFKNIDISRKDLIHEGSMTWRVSKDKAVDVHVLLLEDLLLLLQKQDERLVLKCQSRTLTPTPEGKLMLSPIIKLNTAIAREVATDNKAFFVIFYWEDRAQIYELVAPTVSDKKNWFHLISETIVSLDTSTSKASKLRPVTPGSLLPPSPSFLTDTSSENGASMKESITKDEKEKEDPVDEGHKKVGDSSSIMEHLLANNIPLYKMNQGELTSEGKVASEALEEVLVLKRLLVRNIRLSMDVDSISNLDSWTGAPQWETGDEEPAQAEGTTNGNREGEDHMKETGSETSEKEEKSNVGSHDAGESLCAPIVLSPEQSEEVRKHILVLEQRVQQLKLIEEEYNHLQRTVAQFTVSQSNFT
ncbi:rho guanine nucleotide exchange factor 1 isoform X2 [Bombina bombina]|uniref:rho guanine nucleotide exchange factor 1 isoform X2 n=1 Tax=Bombina bombina TaxID=8345 RepID=UPI00235A90A2|nr:rho guanine nucleotide exchange factor 1 isoform X2 [Bombina bombina]